MDGLVEIDLTWEPHVIKTNEKITFIYQTYDPFTNSNIDKMKYDLILIQNGEEIFRDKGLTSIGGDYRNYVFEEPGSLEIRFENIESGGTSGIESSLREPVEDLSLRLLKFTAMVYENPDKLTPDIVIQPAKRLELQYEILVAIIVIPGALAVIAIITMVFGKGKKTK
ncbi:MAG: Blue (Type1) copper domain-containing protein [Nitrosopumilales archaeon]|nr:MAG: Blue (Type1) copper domain-containing protein [Nitrosopumilales archaeon]